MRRAACWLILMIALPGAALAQTDEIQVYDASIAEVGQWAIQLHSNYTPIGRAIADYPKGIVPEHAWNGVPEFAYGVTEWFEAGLYLPVYTIRNDGRAELDSGKIRALFVSPYAATRTFVYGVNVELSYNAAHWEQTRFSGEIRPILGVHVGSWDLIVNPIFDTDFHGLGKLDFAPSERIAYNFTPVWAVAIEQYSDFGQLAYLRAADQQAQSLFAVVDYREEGAGNVEFGIGHGFTAGSDGLVFKLIVGMDF